MTISSTSPISKIKKALDSNFGAVPWWNYEVETLLLESGLPPDNLSIEKINVLKVAQHDPEIFYSNFMFFLHAVEVFNNNVTDFEFLPAPTSLEMAFAIIDMAKVLGVEVNHSPAFSTEVRLTIKDRLVSEGYSLPVFPFSVVGLGELEQGQTPSDTENKRKAILEYVSSIYS